MIEGIGYVGAGWCRKCDAVRIRMPQHRRRVCGECGTTIDSPLLLRDAGWPAGLRIDWADRRPQMDADSVRSRLMLVAGDYIERRSFAAQDDTLAAVEGLRADNSGVVRYPASEDEGSPASATLADRMALELRHAAGVARLFLPSYLAPYQAPTNTTSVPREVCACAPTVPATRRGSPLTATFENWPAHDPSVLVTVASGCAQRTVVPVKRPEASIDAGLRWKLDSLLSPATSRA